MSTPHVVPPREGQPLLKVCASKLVLVMGAIARMVLVSTWMMEF